MKKKEKLKRIINLNSTSQEIGLQKLSLNKDLITILTNSNPVAQRPTISQKFCPCPDGSFTLPCPMSRHALCGTVETWEQPYCTLA